VPLEQGSGGTQKIEPPAIIDDQSRYHSI